MNVRNTHRQKTAVSHGPDGMIPFCLVPLREAAAIMRLNPRTLARLVSLERVPAYRFAGMKKLFFKPEELLALLQPTTVRPVQRRRATVSAREAR
jgi:hypothetical protein